MPKPDEVVAEVGRFTVFRKSDSPESAQEYEIVGPAAPNSPLGYSFLRTTPETLEVLRNEIRADVRRRAK